MLRMLRILVIATLTLVAIPAMLMQQIRFFGPMWLEVNSGAVAAFIDRLSITEPIQSELLQHPACRVKDSNDARPITALSGEADREHRLEYHASPG